MSVGLWLGGCVSDTDFRRQQQQLNVLRSEVADLKDQTRLRQMEMERQVTQTRTNLPDIRLEMDRMRTELQRLTDSIENTEQRGVLPGGETLTLRQQLEHIRARLDRIETKLRLRPLGLEVLTGTAPATEEPRITVQPGPSATTPATAAPDEFQTAKDLYQTGDFQAAKAKFLEFLNKNPGSSKAATAQFYIGECFYGQNKYEEAILEYQKVVQKWPRSQRVSNALLKQGYAFLNIGDKTSAKLLLQKVIREYPQSYSAGVAKQKLSTIR